MKSNKLALFIFVFLILLVVGWFYWFQWRPAAVRRECFKVASEGEMRDESGEKTQRLSYEQARKLQEVTENRYSNCLRKHGLRD